MKTFAALMIIMGFISNYVNGIPNQVSDSNDTPLLLTKLIEEGQTTKARVLSSVDPALFAGVKSYSGFISANGYNQFYWFFPAEGKPLESTPWIIWTQGGPGVSSLYGLFKEIGPLKLVDGKATLMDASWASDHSILFIDTPIDSGFSYSDSGKSLMQNDEEAVSALFSLVQQFVKMFPELSKAPLFLAGESYASKFAIVLGHYIHKCQNCALNFKGLALGSAWIDPPTLLHLSTLGEQLGLLDYKQAAEVNKVEEEARNYWKAGDTENYTKKARDSVALTFKYTQLGSSPLLLNNILKDVTTFSTDMATFVNRADVRKALHVGDRKFIIYSSDANQAFAAVEYLTVKPQFEELLEHYAVLCYNGQLDMVVGYPLSVHTHRSLNWSGKEEYRRAERKAIKTEYPGKTLNIIGYTKQAARFTEVMIRNAGHVVPEDQPYAVKQVLNAFVNKYKN